MITHSLRTGLRHVRRRPGLVALVAGVHLVAGLVLSLTVYGVLERVLAPTGFGDVLARDFDLVLWYDLYEQYRPLLGALVSQALWAVPLVWAAKVLLRAGLVYALGRGGERSLTDGVYRHGVRALLLGLLYGAVLGAWLVGVVLVTLAASVLWSGPVATVWIGLVGVPALLVIGFVLVDLMHDYGRTALVLRRQDVVQAWRLGITWPWRRRTALGVYASWLAVAAVLWAVPLLLDAALPAVTTGGVWGLFLLQQLAFAGRAATAVGWLGSEAACYEAAHEAEWPLIA